MKQPKKQPKPKFKQDWSESKPSLHHLYVMWAIPHLLAIEQCIVKLDNFSNMNLLDITTVMIKERDKLVKENSAYAEAHELLKKLAKDKLFPIIEEDAQQ